MVLLLLLLPAGVLRLEPGGNSSAAGLGAGVGAGADSRVNTFRSRHSTFVHLGQTSGRQREGGPLFCGKYDRGRWRERKKESERERQGESRGAFLSMLYA